MTVAILGAGLQGTCVALELARRGIDVDLYERNDVPLGEASTHGEGRIHLGFVYGKDGSHRTARTMLSGAIHFERLIMQWLESDNLAVRRSDPTYYTVHAGSCLSAEAVGVYLSNVCAQYQDLAACAGQRYFDVERMAVRKLEQSELEEFYDPQVILAAFETPEICIDARALAARLIAAVAASDRINLLTRTTVLAVRPNGAERIAVESAAGSMRQTQTYRHVVNALWTDRLRIDATFGIRPGRDWLYRYKVGIRIRAPSVRVIIPSTQIVLGPYGSIVSWGDGTYYLAWYEPCRRGITAQLSPAAVDFLPNPEEEDRIARDTVAGLRGICPAVADLANVADREVSGGFIFAWGSTDLDDPNTGLHERHAIGVHSHGTYHSVDTGKLTMAPYFAVQVADRIANG